MKVHPLLLQRSAFLTLCVAWVFLTQKLTVCCACSEVTSTTDLTKFNVPVSHLQTEALKNLKAKMAKPKSTTYFGSEWILDEDIMKEAHAILKCDTMAVSCPRQKTLYCCNLQDALNPEITPNFIEFSKLVYREAKPTAGDFLSTVVFTFKGDGQCYGYVKEGEEIRVSEVTEITEVTEGNEEKK